MGFALYPLPDLLSQESGQIAMFDSKTQGEYEELNHQRQLNRIVEGAETARQRKISEAEIKMRAEIVAKARAEKETQVTAFMRDLVAQLRTMVYEASTDILGTIQKNRPLASPLRGANSQPGRGREPDEFFW